MEVKTRNRLIIIVTSILAITIIFVLLFFHVKASNYKYHRKLFGNEKTYTMIEKKVFGKTNKSISDLFHGIGLSTMGDGDFPFKVDSNLLEIVGNNDELIGSLKMLEDIYFTNLEDVKYESSELFLEDEVFEVDLYQTNIRTHNFINFAKEAIDLLKEDENFYYLGNSLKEYPIIKEELIDVSSKEDWMNYLDRKWEGIKDRKDFRLFHIVNFDNDREIISRFINISRGGDIVFNLVFENYQVDNNYKFGLKLNYIDEYNLSGDYTIEDNKKTGLGNVMKNNEDIGSFDFKDIALVEKDKLLYILGEGRLERQGNKDIVFRSYLGEEYRIWFE